MNVNTTESWILNSTSFPIWPVITSADNKSGMDAYLQRLAHLDEGLYNDFYGLWIALMVINSFIFLVMLFIYLFFGILKICSQHWVKAFNTLSSLPPSNISGGNGTQHCGALCVLFPHQTKDHFSDLHY